jgi:glucose/arabinose dehydrogenase
VAELDKHAAAAGVALAEDGFGSIGGASAFVAEWAKGVVLRVGLGSADGGSVEPFLTGLHKPVPVAIAPDGALLVGDWAAGTVYRIAPG